MNVGEIWAALRIDGSKAKADATKAGEQAGDAAGTAMGARLKKGAAVIGAAVAGGLTVALTGRMLDLERATANFRKETGATADEADRASKAINDMAGRNIQGVDEIGATLTKVHTDLGLVGDEAERVTEQFLKFGQATGQDSTEAVLAFDDVLDSWNLTADQAKGLMDQLVRSHQIYGGVVSDNEKLLSQLAPALQAANFQLDDANGLLNLFNHAGVDGEAATTAFNRAVAKVKSPEELKTLLEDIASTGDAFLRSQKSSALFGNRAGPKLALALADSKGDLDAFKVSLDDAKGATDKAADASLTLGDRIKVAFSGIVSTATEVLGPAGPLLTAIGGLASVFGPVLSKSLAGAWKLVGGPALRLAISAAGAAAGAIYAGAEVVVSAFADGVRALWSGLLSRAGVRAAIAAAGAESGAIFAGAEGATGFIAAFRAALIAGMGGAAIGIPDPFPKAIQSWLDLLKQQPDLLARATLGELQQNLVQAQKVGDTVAAALIQGYIDGFGKRASAQDNAVAISMTWGTTIGKAAMDGAAEGVAANGDHFVTVAGEQGEAAAVASADAVVSNADKARRAWRTLMSEGLEEVRKGLRDTVNNFSTAVVDMKDRIKTGKAGVIEQFRDLAWQSKHPFAEENYANWLQEKHDDAMAKAKKAAKDGRPGVAAQYRALAESIQTEMDALPTAAAKANEESATALAQLLARVLELRNAAHQAFNESATWNGAATGFVIVPGHAAGGRTGAGPMLLGEDGPELFWPDRPGFVSTAPETAAIRGAGTSRLDVHIHAEGDGMARAGIGVAELGDWVLRGLRGAADSSYIGSLSPKGI